MCGIDEAPENRIATSYLNGLPVRTTAINED